MILVYNQPYSMPKQAATRYPMSSANYLILHSLLFLYFLNKLYSLLFLSSGNSNEALSESIINPKKRHLVLGTSSFFLSLTKKLEDPSNFRDPYTFLSHFSLLSSTHNKSSR